MNQRSVQLSIDFQRCDEHHGDGVRDSAEAPGDRNVACSAGDYSMVPGLPQVAQAVGPAE